MTRRRWIADEVSGDRAALIGAHAQHLARVLRARIGQEFDITTGENVRRGRIASISSDRIEFDLGDEISARETARITLLLAIIKFDRMEWAIEKCTELGVARIVPFIARRSDPHLAAAAVKRVERWRRIAREASEQSRRTRLPEIADPIKVAEAANFSGGVRILLAESEDQARLPDILPPDADEITLAIGPEGGWTDDELKRFRQAGWVFASLGDTILRAETAAIAAIAIVMANLK